MAYAPLVRASRLNRRVQIMKPIESRGSLGGHAETWTPLAPPVWAEIRDMSGREIYNSQQMGSDATKLVTIRFRADVTNAMQLILRNYPASPIMTTARIEWVNHIEQQYLELYCRVING